MKDELERLRGRLQREKTLVLPVRVMPKSPRSEWAALMADGTWKIRIQAVPERGKANEELIRFLASEFSVSRAQVEIFSGQTSHNKQVRLRA